MVFEHLVLYMQTSSGLISNVWNETNSKIYKVVSFQRSITKAMLSANSFSIQAQILWCSKHSLKWYHERFIKFKRNNTKPMLLLTLIWICAKIIVFSNYIFKWNHNWMVSLQTKTTKTCCALFWDLFMQMSDQQIFSNMKKRCCDVFCAPELIFFKPSDTCLDFITFCVFVTTCGEIWDQSILPRFSV